MLYRVIRKLRQISDYQPGPCAKGSPNEWFPRVIQLRLRNWDALPFAANQIDAVVLTHAHIDHSGYLPLLIKNGFKGRVYCTTGTRDLCQILLPDAGHLQEEDARYINKHGFSKHRQALPLYTEQDAQRALKHLQPVAFDTSTALGNGISFRLLPAGHILGAAIIAFEIDGKRLVFSGDLGRSHDPIMQPPALPGEADYTEILAWLGTFTCPPKNTFITHGEPAAADELRRRIRETLDWPCTIPNYLDCLPL